MLDLITQEIAHKGGEYIMQTTNLDATDSARLIELTNKKANQGLTPDEQEELKILDQKSRRIV